KRPSLRRDGPQPADQLVAVDLGLIEPAQQRVVVQQELVNTLLERLRIGQVADPQRPPPDLVLIGRADAAAGRPDPAVAEPFLAGTVEGAVRGQDQGRIVGELQILWIDFDAFRPDYVDFVDQRPGIDDHPIADDRQLAGPHYP